MEVSAAPIFKGDGPVRQVVLVSRDVTDLVAAQEAIEDSRRQAEQASQAKSAFLATMSHEIRTPPKRRDRHDPPAVGHRAFHRAAATGGNGPVIGRGAACRDQRHPGPFQNRSGPVGTGAKILPPSIWWWKTCWTTWPVRPRVKTWNCGR